MELKQKYNKKGIFMAFLDAIILITMCLIYGNAKTEQLWFTYMGIFAWIILSIILIFINFHHNKKMKIFSFISIWYLIFTFICYISIKWSILPDLAKENFAFIYKTAIVLILMDIYINNIENGLEKILKYFFIALTYLSIKTIVFFPFDEVIGASTGLQFNNVAQILSIGANIAFYKFYYSKKNIYIIPFILMIIVVFMTTSRKAFLFLFLGIFLQLILVKGTKQKFKAIFIISGLLLITLTLIFSVDSLYEKFGVRLLYIFSYFNGSGMESIDTSVIERTFYANQAIQLFKLSPIKGSGLMSVYSSLLISNAKYVAYAHNNYLEILASLGIIGLITYYSSYVYILLNAILKWKTRNKNLILWFTILTILMISQIGVVAYYFNFYQIIILLVYSKIIKRNKDYVETDKN